MVVNCRITATITVYHRIEEYASAGWELVGRPEDCRKYLKRHGWKKVCGMSGSCSTRGLTWDHYDTFEKQFQNIENMKSELDDIENAFHDTHVWDPARKETVPVGRMMKQQEPRN